MNEAFVWLSVEQASQYTGLGKSTFDHMRQRGDGPRYVLRARRVLYRKDWVDAWLLEGTRHSTSENAPCDEAQAGLPPVRKRHA